MKNEILAGIANARSAEEIYAVLDATKTMVTQAMIEEVSDGKHNPDEYAKRTCGHCKFSGKYVYLGKFSAEKVTCYYYKCPNCSYLEIEPFIAE